MKLKLIITFLFVTQFSFAQKTPTADDIVNKYLLLTGNLKNTPSFSYQLTSGGVQGNRIKFKSPTKLYMAYVSEADDMVRIHYNGKTYNEFYPVSKKSKELNQDKFCREVLSNMIFPELLVTALKIKAHYEGEETIGNQKTYKIKFETTTGTKWFEYFEVNSGLKIRTAFEIKTDEGDMMKTTLDFQNYEDLDAFHLPKVLTITMGAFDMQYFVKNFKANEPMDDAIFEAEN